MAQQPEQACPPDEPCSIQGEGAPPNWYLVQFAHKYLEFRQPELESLAQLAESSLQIPLPWIEPPAPSLTVMLPYYKVALPNDEVAARVTSRSMLTKGLYELWGEGGTWEELQASVEAFPESRKAPWQTADKTYKVIVDPFGAVLSMDEQMEHMKRLAYVFDRSQGKVNLGKTVDVIFHLKVLDTRRTRGVHDADLSCYRLYLARQVSLYSHAVVERYKLPCRPYIGPTSMDAEMAFIMCNMAGVRPGQLVFDPYMGTGSIGVATAHFGAFMFGSDIDIRIIRNGKIGKSGKHVDIRSNFQEYGTLPLLAGLISADLSHHPFRAGLEEVFHSIIADPPYGVRAGGKKTAHRQIEIRDRATHIPGTEAYNLGECLRDLLDFAARMLMVGGRLVFFMPSTPDTYCEEEVPSHPALRLLYNSEQLLTPRYSRRLMTMEKLHAYDKAAADAWHALKPDPTMKIDKLTELVFMKYERDADGKTIFPPEALNPKSGPFRGKMV